MDQQKMASIARILCEEVSMVLRESEGQRYFATGTRYSSWDEFNGDHDVVLQFGESTNMIPDVDELLAAREARAGIVSTASAALSEALGPIGTFSVVRMPELVHDARCPAEQVQGATCDIQDGYPHVRCVVVADKTWQKQCFATLDLAYYRVS